MTSLWRHKYGLKYRFFKNRHIVYRWKGNFKLIKTLFGIRVWKLTPGEIISTQWRHYDVTNTVWNTDFSKIDIMYTAPLERKFQAEFLYNQCLQNYSKATNLLTSAIIVTSWMNITKKIIRISMKANKSFITFDKPQTHSFCKLCMIYATVTQSYQSTHTRSKEIFDETRYKLKLKFKSYQFEYRNC